MRGVHRKIRDLAAAKLDTAFGSLAIDLPVIAQDEPNPTLASCPAVIVWLGGDESKSGGTNVRDDIVYPLLIGLFTIKASPDTASPDNDPPGIHPADFREVLRQVFNNQRSLDPAGIPNVYLFPSEYNPEPPLFDTVSPEALDQLRTVVGVTIMARVPRGLQQ